MIFISGISTREKDLDFSTSIICPVCQAWGRLEAFMTYTSFSLFFIPIINWNKRYFLRSTCCNSLFSLGDNLGSNLEKSRPIDLGPEDLNIVSRGFREDRCESCNKLLDSHYDYCPYCGRRRK